MTQDTVMDLIRSGIFTILLASGPPLLMGLAVGLIVSIFQAVTSIQEQTLAFIPKILAVLLAILLFGPFMLSNMQGYMNELVTNLPYYTTPRY